MDVPIAQARAATTEPNTVNSLIPVHLREGAQNFIDLLEDYYTYLNTDGQPSQEISNILIEQDIDETSLQYLNSIQKEVAKNVPDAVAFDRVALYKKIVKYYLTKGSRDSILTFFKIFYDEAVVVSYPKELLFAPSQGNYDRNINRYLDGKSFPSGTDKVQDSYFWQNFSYVIESALPVENWKSNFLNLVHPAGFKFFGIIAILMVRTNNWIGRHIRFDDVARKYILTDDFDPKIYNYPYQTKERDDLDWMRGLVPPALLTTVDRYSFNEGYHSPTFQYGVVPLETLLNILIIKNLDEDRFNLFVEVILNYVITEPGNHFLRTRDTYLQDTKFLDSDGFSEFKDKKIGESLDDNLLMSQRILHNVSAFVKQEITVSQETRRSILKRVEGIAPSTTTKDLYTEASYNSSLNFVRNEQCWAKDIKGITAISPWNSAGGRYRAGTAISPRHVIFVEHGSFHPNVGDTLYFVTRDNVIISRQLIQHKNHPASGYGAGDFGIGLLDTPLPDSVEFMKVLPEDSYNYFPITSLSNNDFEWKYSDLSDTVDKPYLFNIDQEEKANIRSLERIRWRSGRGDNPDTYDYTYMYYGDIKTESDAAGIASSSEWFELAISGDSGNPIMMVLKGEAVLVSIFTTAATGPFFGQQRNNNEVNLLIEDVDALARIDNSADITSFVYNTTAFNEEGEQVQRSNTFTKASFVLNGRPVYLGEGALDSIAWDGNEWIEYDGGATMASTNNSLDTAYPWQIANGKDSAEGFKQFTPNLVFGTGHKLTQFDFKSENEVEVFSPLIDTVQDKEISIPVSNNIIGDFIEINGTSFDTTASHIKIENVGVDTRLNGTHKLVNKSSTKLMIKTPNYNIHSNYPVSASITLGKLDTYIAPSKYKKYTENIQQIKNKFSEDSSAQAAQAEPAPASDSTHIRILYGRFNAPEANVFSADIEGGSIIRQTQVGSTIQGANTNDAVDEKMGASVSLSRDGNIAAISSIYARDYAYQGGMETGNVKVYEYDGTSWSQKGSTLYAGEIDMDSFVGISVDLSDDGLKLLVQSAGPNGNEGHSQAASTYYIFESGDWVMKGSPSQLFRYGYRGQMSNDGNVIVVTNPEEPVSPYGKAFIFEYDSANDSWSNRETIELGYEGGTGLDINSDGSRICINTRNTVKVFEWNGSSYDLMGTEFGFISGSNKPACRMNDTGNIVVISGTNGLRVYRWNDTSWTEDLQTLGTTGIETAFEINSTGDIIVNDRWDVFQYTNSSWSNVGNINTGGQYPTVNNSKSYPFFGGQFPIGFTEI
jgi:hypothetical protein